MSILSKHPAHSSFTELQTVPLQGMMVTITLTEPLRIYALSVFTTFKIEHQLRHMAGVAPLPSHPFMDSSL